MRRTIVRSRNVNRHRFAGYSTGSKLSVVLREVMRNEAHNRNITRNVNTTKDK